MPARSPFAKPKLVSMVSGGVLFTAYVFNFGGTQNFFDNLFSGFYSSSQAHTEQVGKAYNAALPFVLIGMFAVVGYAFWLSRKQAAWSKEKNRPLTWREAVTLNGFVSSAAKHEVQPEVAREAFRLLLPFCRYGLRTRMADTLRGDLRMRDAEVDDLFSDLMAKTGRKYDQKLGQLSIETVQDLLVTAQKCPKAYKAENEGAALSERRGEENWVVRPVQQ
ncbi:hypothetical protein [Granulicella rosea]|nr:hypothetical protein [Granulicella rosea]